MLCIAPGDRITYHAIVDAGSQPGVHCSAYREEHAERADSQAWRPLKSIICRLEDIVPLRLVSFRPGWAQVDNQQPALVSLAVVQALCGRSKICRVPEVRQVGCRFGKSTSCSGKFTKWESSDTPC